MKIELVEIKDADDFDSPELKKRAQESSKSTKTIHYRVLADGREAGFVSLDRWPELGHMVLYEIFIAESLRHRGIASATLARVESTAASEGLLGIRLRPSPLDQEISQENLAAWYSRRGYQRDPIITDDMKKQLQKLD